MTANSHLFRGIVPPIVTPLNTNGEVDKTGTQALVEKLISAGVNGLFILGTIGEFSQMTADLRKQVTEAMITSNNHRVPSIVNIGSTSTLESIELARHAKSAGAEAIACINPYYINISQDYLISHYVKIAEASELPLVLYNFPDLTHQDLSADWILRLIEKCPQIIGIKDSVSEIDHTVELIKKVKKKYPNFSVMSGYDHHLYYNLLSGGDGGVPASANFIPFAAVELLKAFKKGQFDKALQLHQILNNIPDLFAIDHPFSNVIKEAAKRNGINLSTYVLPPAQNLSSDKKQELGILLDTLLTGDATTTKPIF